MYEIILQRLEAERNPEALVGMAGYGITPTRWVAGDALRELTGTAVQNRLKSES
jgi:hypothetical protein